MAFCSNCGQKLEEGAKFCQACGTQVLDSSMSQGAIKPKKGGFFGKLKEAAETAKVAYEQAAKENEEKRALRAAAEAERKAAEAERKAAEEAKRAELMAKAKEVTDRIVSEIEQNYSDDLDGFFNGKTKDEVFAYSRNLFDKILLPVNSKNTTYISMYPQIPKKLYDKFRSTFDFSLNYEDCLIYLNGNDGNEFLLTYETFYFKLALPENKDITSIGMIPTSQVSLFSLTPNEGGDSYCFACDDVKIADLSVMSGKISDFVTLNNFFADIKNRDFDITDEDVDKSIREKLGSQTLIELGNEMDEGELLLFFTWNSDGGYIACTTEKIIWAERKSGGNVSNTSRFYYDEITKIETIQEASNLTSTSSAETLTGFLFDMAISAAADAAIDSFLKDVCDLKIVAAGSVKLMSGMVKLEADRIVAIYHAFKKDLRAEAREQRKMAATPQVVVQQQAQPDIIEQIQKLASLRDVGILTEEEFSTKKAELLAKL